MGSGTSRSSPLATNSRRTKVFYMGLGKVAADGLGVALPRPKMWVVVLDHLGGEMRLRWREMSMPSSFIAVTEWVDGRMPSIRAEPGGSTSMSAPASSPCGGGIPRPWGCGRRFRADKKDAATHQIGRRNEEAMEPDPLECKAARRKNCLDRGCGGALSLSPGRRGRAAVAGPLPGVSPPPFFRPHVATFFSSDRLASRRRPRPHVLRGGGAGGIRHPGGADPEPAVRRLPVECGDDPGEGTAEESARGGGCGGAAFDGSGLCGTPEIAGPGFINFGSRTRRWRRAERNCWRTRRGWESLPRTPRTIVLTSRRRTWRSRCTWATSAARFWGDGLGRIATFLGQRVISDNHIGSGKRSSA